MRIHRLSATAFGPFPDEVEVDFDALTAAGLFLIHGPTGAGKTSLLDAICFALFADVPGLRDKRGIVSDHAAPTATPAVELEFTSGTRRFRLHRSPAHARPKKRGTGTIEAPATVTLSEHRGGEWTVLSTRNDEAAEVIHDVVGMGKEQFAKVAMLPQGEFAAFLTAKDEDRRGLLEKLFDISRFADVEDWLVEQRRASEAEVRSRRTGIDTDLARLADVVAASGLAGPDPDADLTPATREQHEVVDAESPQEIRQRLDELGEALDAHLSEAMVALDAALADERTAAVAAEQGRAVATLRQRARTARESLATLDLHEGDVSAVRLEHSAASRAAGLSGHLAALARAEAEAEATCSTVSLAHRGVLAFVPTAGDPDAVLDALHLHDDAVRELVRLGAAREVRAQLLRQHLEAVEVATAVLDSADADREHARTEVVAAETALAGAVEAEATLDGVEQTARAAADRHRLAERVVRDEEAVSLLVAASVAARTAAQDARDHEQDLVGQRLSQMAAELAEGLVDGSSCPVCGAHEHPAPARGTDRVTAAELDLARRAHADLARSAQEAESAAAAARAVLTEALSVLGATEARDLDLSELAAVADAAADAVQVVRVRAGARPGLERRLAAARDTAARVEVGVTEARHDLARASTVAERAQQDERVDAEAARRLVAAHAHCPCRSGRAGDEPVLDRTARDTAGDRDGVPDAHALLRAHRDAVAAAEGWRDAVAAHEATDARLSAAQSTVAAAAREAGFATLDDAAAAVRSPATVDRLRDRLHDHDRARAAAESVLADPDVREAEAAPAPDLDALMLSAQVARTALLAAQSAQTGAMSARTSFLGVSSSLTAALDASGPALERHHRVKELADTFTGAGSNNSLRMRLTAYVLAARLEKVAQLANERLRIMGDGRYRLEHSDRLAARGARSGLGLRVLDQWTGVSRETSTLSGGEAFMASLALALGLADAVREESGGFDIGTLFVDEGFGTLDDESLEQVISVLDTLREGGRAVGVVSHVAELRSRITSQLSVRKTASGSTVVVSTPGAESAA
ncbi:AAA family ATPase [Knoellia sp. CPCC 206435]|uniref:AAA family ATPase n=1 Tax=Knoellia terrae TaxID=3404797 RepID=UPI003B427EA3